LPNNIIEEKFPKIQYLTVFKSCQKHERKNQTCSFHSSTTTIFSVELPFSGTESIDKTMAFLSILLSTEGEPLSDSGITERRVSMAPTNSIPKYFDVFMDAFLISYSQTSII